MPLLPVSHHEQLQQSDCLAACAAMVLDYLGFPAEYDTLLSRLQVGEYGALIGNLRFLEKFGVKVLIARGEIETLRSCLARALPPIAFVDTNELSYWNAASYHAVVVIGIEGNRIFINDPAFADAPKKISVDEFMLAWIGLEQFYALIERADKE
ncbi:MAG: hypothetical protein HY741_00910 [Chloroflexi bacterium]|nr:hypothetical protein [Chloroflexota bacterium]